MDYKCDCETCFYRNGPNNPKDDCQYGGEVHPKEIFGLEKDQIMPFTIDDKSVGNYCPKYLHNSSE